MANLYKQTVTGNSNKVTLGDPEKYPNWKSDKGVNTQNKATLPSKND